MDRRDEPYMIGGGKAADRLFVRFRPIAPKPPSGDGDSGSGGFQAGNNVINNALFAKARAKRKYVRVVKTKANNIGKKGKGIVSVQEREDDSSRRVTLQLMPEKVDDHHASPPKAKAQETWCENPRYPPKEIEVIEERSNNKNLAVTWVHMNGTILQSPNDPTVAMHQQIRATKIETWVIVEALTRACDDDAQVFDLGRTDSERLKSLESDTCPGFLSDLSSRVRWINGAFKEMVSRRMMAAGSGGSVSEIAVGLVAKDQEILQYNYKSSGNYVFSCKVNVQYTWREERWSGGVMPCDVWRMVDSGGFAWRLDVKAALSLGR